MSAAAASAATAVTDEDVRLFLKPGPHGLQERVRQELRRAQVRLRDGRLNHWRRNPEEVHQQYINIYAARPEADRGQRIHICMYVCMHVRMHACMHVCMYACMYICMQCMYVCKCMYVCMHVCI